MLARRASGLAGQEALFSDRHIAIPHMLELHTPSSLGQPSDSLVNRDCELSADKDENRDIGYLKV
jgi:hypothetical protein